jgi:hypothetical protein
MLIWKKVKGKITFFFRNFSKILNIVVINAFFGIIYEDNPLFTAIFAKNV